MYTLKFFSLQIRERELNDNLKYRAKLEEAEKCSKEVDQINSRLKGLDATKLNAQYTELTRKLEQLKNEVSVFLTFTFLAVGPAAESGCAFFLAFPAMTPLPPPTAVMSHPHS